MTGNREILPWMMVVHTSTPDLAPYQTTMSQAQGNTRKVLELPEWCLCSSTVHQRAASSKAHWRGSPFLFSSFYTAKRACNMRDTWEFQAVAPILKCAQCICWKQDFANGLSPCYIEAVKSATHSLQLKSHGGPRASQCANAPSGPVKESCVTVTAAVVSGSEHRLPVTLAETRPEDAVTQATQDYYGRPTKSAVGQIYSSITSDTLGSNAALAGQAILSFIIGNMLGRKRSHQQGPMCLDSHTICTQGGVNGQDQHTKRPHMLTLNMEYNVFNYFQCGTSC